MIYVDINNDENFLLLQEALIEMDLPKEARAEIQKVDPDVDYSDLIKEAFADEENRMFPLATEEDTVLSAVYFLKQAESISDGSIKSKISEALSDWGIDYLSVDTMEKEASVLEQDPDFVLAKRKKLPVVDKDTLLKSASVFSSSINSLSLPERVEGAINLNKFATEYGVPFSSFGEDIGAYSLTRGCDLSKLSVSILDRLENVDAESAVKYEEMLTKISGRMKDGELLVNTPEDAMGIASTLIDLDKTAELLSVFDPIKDVFNADIQVEEGLEKVASEEAVAIGSYNIPLVKIASMSSEEAGRRVGDIATNFTDDGSINIDKLEVFMGELTPTAQNEVAKRFLA